MSDNFSPWAAFNPTGTVAVAFSITHWIVNESVEPSDHCLIGVTVIIYVPAFVFTWPSIFIEELSKPVTAAVCSEPV